MVEVGAKVTHKTFGTGEVTWIDKAGKHIRVEFSAGEKTFIFPDAFKQGFLKPNPYTINVVEENLFSV